MTTNTNFIVTQDEFGNDRMFAGCVNFEATWTLQVDKAVKFDNFELALSIAKQFPGFRIVNADSVLGPYVKATGGPDYLMKII